MKLETGKDFYRFRRPIGLLDGATVHEQYKHISFMVCLVSMMTMTNFYLHSKGKRGRPGFIALNEDRSGFRVFPPPDCNAYTLRIRYHPPAREQ